MLPYLAQGGVLALEDALVLADCSRRPSRNEPQALPRLRRPAPPARRAACRPPAGATAASITCGRRSRWARDAVLRVGPGARLMAGYDWLYGWREDASPKAICRSNNKYLTSPCPGHRGPVLDIHNSRIIYPVS